MTCISTDYTNSFVMLEELVEENQARLKATVHRRSQWMDLLCVRGDF